MNIKALVPGIVTRARRAGITLRGRDAEMLAAEMLELESFEDRMAHLDARLSALYDRYSLHLFLTRPPNYRVTVH